MTALKFNNCVRYVNNDAELCEDFLGFLKLEKMEAQSIIDVMIPSLQRLGLDFSLLVAQSCDGPSVMSSNIAGVQAEVHALYPNVTYVHCRSHVLDLAISSNCRDVSLHQESVC